MMHPDEQKDSTPSLIGRRVTLNGLQVELRVESLLWEAVDDVCEREGLTLDALCAVIDSRRGAADLTAALQFFIVTYYRAAVAKNPTGFQEDGVQPSRHLLGALEDAAPFPKG